MGFGQSPFIRLRFFPSECRDYLESGLKISQRLATQEIETYHLLHLGTFLNSVFKYIEAKTYFDQAIQLAEKLDMKKAQCQILNEMAQNFLASNKADEVIQCLIKKQNIEISNNLEIDSEVTWARLGLAYEQKEEIEKAIHALKEGQHKAKETGNSSCLKIIFKHLGICYTGTKEFSKAEEYFEASLSMARSLHNRKEELDILHKQGKMYVESGDTDHALHTFNEGYELAKASRRSKFEGIFLARMGDTYSLTSEKQKAASYYMQALKPLKKAKELSMVEEIQERLNRSHETGDSKSEELERIVKPVHKSKQGRGLILMQARTNEFIKIGDSKMINYYISSVEEIIQDYQLNLKDSKIREKLNKQMGVLRDNNQHACATILKQKFQL